MWQYVVNSALNLPTVYDLVDPTERTNLADVLPAVVKKLKRRLQRLKKTEVSSVHKKGGDPRGDPSHFNGTYASGWC